VSDCTDHGRKGNVQGYARISYNGRNVLLHRLVYFGSVGLDIGTAPSTLVVRHSCDNPRCINVEHLSCGSQADNVADMMSRGRHVALHGEAHGSTVYSDALVATIKSVYQPRVYGVRAIAKDFGISKSHVHNIVKGANRCHK
jgi:hypothetical protein